MPKKLHTHTHTLIQKGRVKGRGNKATVGGAENENGGYAPSAAPKCKKLHTDMKGSFSSMHHVPRHRNFFFLLFLVDISAAAVLQWNWLYAYLICISLNCSCTCRERGEGQRTAQREMRVFFQYADCFLSSYYV
uniref:Uncharacterized protein n=1 Tax=Sinocyclocheilus anshuiensis TaxID=1608454 RepID=A0A671KMC0_9TELE